MTTHWLELIGAVFLLTYGGYWIVGTLMLVMRRHVFGKHHPIKESFGRLELWLGSVERIIATLLFVGRIPYLGAFIGAWITAKLAANWQRFKDDSEATRKGTLMALIGSAFSFALAIGVGIWLNPSAISSFVTK